MFIKKVTILEVLNITTTALFGIISTYLLYKKNILFLIILWSRVERAQVNFSQKIFFQSIYSLIFADFFGSIDISQ